MSQKNETHCIQQSLPSEMLLMIFQYLPAKQLIKLRQVCTRFRDEVDEMTRSDSFWWEHCRRDYPTEFKVARSQAEVGMQWFNIYRSLSLWSQLMHACEIRHEFFRASTLDEEIKGFQILKDGDVGVHKQGSIDYYNTKSLTPIEREPITGDYMRYNETDDVIILRGYRRNLFLIRKVLRQENSEPNVTLDGVRTSLIVDQELYYVDLRNNIHVCNLKDKNLSLKKLSKHSEESIMCLGYRDNLNILTYKRKIYSMVKGNLVLACVLDESDDVLNELYKFKLMEEMDWRVFYQWMSFLGRQVPAGPLQNILTVRVYRDDVIIVGCKYGVLRIYLAPFKDGKLDLYNTKPVKQYNFMERSDFRNLHMCSILKTDVMETVHGHKIIVAMPKKITVLHFVHLLLINKSSVGCENLGNHFAPCNLL